MKPARRDVVIDVLRGLAVLSMALEHLAPRFGVTRLVHSPAALDGASGFVLLSGLVLGMVQPSRLRRDGLRGAQRLLLRRAALLYLIHVALVVSVVLAGWTTARTSWMPAPEQWSGGWSQEVLDAALLRVNPADFDILPMYVVFLLLAVCAVELLARRGAWVLLLASTALYVLSQVDPSATVLPASPDAPAFFNWGSWQLLFVSGLVVGWHWRSHDLRTRLRSPAVVAVAAVALIALEVPALLLQYAPPAGFDGVHWVFVKSTAGPGLVLLAWTGFVLLYAGMTRLLDGRPPTALVSTVDRLGRSSLSGLVIISLVVVAAAMAGIRPSDSVVTGFVALGCIVIMVLWSNRRGRRGASRPVLPQDGSSPLFERPSEPFGLPRG